jgi:carbonic anhydrase/acetyltransferase-like protein (isoleucine patch superfamily)
MIKIDKITKIGKITAFSMPTGLKIPPFNDPVRDLLILNTRLEAFQKENLSHPGLIKKGLKIENKSLESKYDNPSDSGSAFMYYTDNLLFSHEFITEFLLSSIEHVKSSLIKPGSTEKTLLREPVIFRAALKKTLYQKQFAIIQTDCDDTAGHIEFNLFFVITPALKENDLAGDNFLSLTNTADIISFFKKSSKNVIIDVEEFYEDGNFPSHMLNKDNFKYALTRKMIMSVCEPLHIGLANVAANCARIARYKKPGFFNGLKAISAVFKTILTSVTLKKQALVSGVLRCFSQIHPSASIHPTAVIEGSVIGPNAKIGAYAVVRFSVIGEKVFVDDHAGIKFSVLGEGSYIANNNVIFFTTVYPGAFLISGPYHFSCFGRNSAIMNSIPSDYRLDGKTIKVMTSKGLMDTGLKFAGSIFGHNTRVAAGLIFAPGRAVPNNLTLYPDPGRVITSVPDQDSKPFSGPVKNIECERPGNG